MSVARFGFGHNSSFRSGWRDEEYGDFHELAEVTGCLDKWEPILESVTEVIVVNE